MSDPKTPTATDPKAETPAKTSGGKATELTAAAAAKKLKAKVRVFVTRGKGDEAKTEPADVTASAEHILDFRVEGGEIHVVTVDGQKHTVAA